MLHSSCLKIECSVPFGRAGVPGRRYPALERLLAAGQIVPIQPGADRHLLARFGWNDGEEPPLAALSLLGEGLNPQDAVWLRADPVHLQLQRDRLVMLESACADLAVDEAAVLVRDLNRHFLAAGLTLHAPHPQRWYWCLPAPLVVHTRFQDEVTGRTVVDSLPSGRDATICRQWFNEAQMLLHEHPVNVAREARGMPVVNSLWLCGCGALPLRLAAPVGRVWADMPLPRGLALASGAQVLAVPAGADAVLEQPVPGGQLVVFAADDWAGLEEHWCVPLLRALRQRKLVALELVLHVPGRSLCCRVRWLDPARFWRLRRPLETCFA